MGLISSQCLSLSPIAESLAESLAERVECECPEEGGRPVEEERRGRMSTLRFAASRSKTARSGS